MSMLCLPSPDPDAYQSAVPCPHAVVDDVLTAEGAEAVRSFPDEAWERWSRYADRYQPQKMICSDSVDMPEAFRRLFAELASPPVLSWVESLTGIEALLPDPYLEGGGLHATAEGGVLTPHTDFHYYRRLGLYRRVNAILYLNEDWTADDGGSLEFFERGATHPTTTVVPSFGRLVVFRTDDRSIHGFTEPVAPGRFRRSAAVYYYTAVEAPEYSGDSNVYWQHHGSGGPAHRARLGLYRGAVFLSRGFAYVAHHLNPNIEDRKNVR